MKINISFYAFIKIILTLFLLVHTSCGKNSINISNFSLQVDFDSNNKTMNLLKQFGTKISLTACDEKSSSDNSESSAGLDCDGDGGVVAFQTPSRFKMALKRLYFITTSGEEDVVSYPLLKDIDEKGIFEFTPNTLTHSVPLGSSSYTEVTGLGVEVYYYQMELTMYGAKHEIRIYMSDDDFPKEGNLGHHQGDITYFDKEGKEHWAFGGNQWFAKPEETLVRGDFANGAGKTDPETKHQRGMFGDSQMWNDSRFMQGASQDIYTTEVEFEEVNGTHASLVFNIHKRWFYEDFERTHPKSFDPCYNDSDEGCGGEWAPLLPKIEAQSSSEPQKSEAKQKKDAEEQTKSEEKKKKDQEEEEKQKALEKEKKDQSKEERES